MNKPLTPDFIGHCLDTAIPFAIGIVGLIYYQWRIAKDINTGKRTEAEGKSRLKKVRIFCCLILLFGIVKVSEFWGKTSLVVTPTAAQAKIGALAVQQLIDAVNARGEDKLISAKTVKHLHLGSEALPSKKILLQHGANESEGREVAICTIKNDATYLVFVYKTSTEFWTYVIDEDGRVKMAEHLLIGKSSQDISNSPEISSLIATEE